MRQFHLCPFFYAARWPAGHPGNERGKYEYDGKMRLPNLQNIISFRFSCNLVCIVCSQRQGTLKGSFTIFLFLVRSHILNSNGVWYW